MVLGMGGGGRVVEDVAEGAAAPALVYCGLYRLLVLTPFTRGSGGAKAACQVAYWTLDSMVLPRMGPLCPGGQLMWCGVVPGSPHLALHVGVISST